MNKITALTEETFPHSSLTIANDKNVKSSMVPANNEVRDLNIDENLEICADLLKSTTPSLKVAYFSTMTSQPFM